MGQPRRSLMSEAAPSARGARRLDGGSKEVAEASTRAATEGAVESTARGMSGQRSGAETLVALPAAVNSSCDAPGPMEQ